MKEDGANQRSVTWAMVVIAVFAALCVGVWTVWLIPINDPVYGLFNMGVDNHVYRGGAEAVWNSTPLYDGPVYRVWQFTYPPFAALVLVPLAWMSSGGALVVWHVINVGCLLGLVALSMRSLRYRMDARFWMFVVAFSVFVVCLEPVHTTIWNGQINLVLAVLVVADLVRRSDRLRGIGVGLAAGIKLTPIFFTAYLVITRQWKAAITSVVTFAATVLLGIAVLGAQGMHFWTVQLHETGRIGPLDHPANQSLNGFFARLAPEGLAHTPSWLWVPTGLAVGALGLWAAWAAHKAEQELLAISITGMTSAAVSPFSWGHHWVWVVPLLLVAVTQVADVVDRRRPVTWWWLLAPSAVVALTFTWWHREKFVTTDGAEHLKFTFGVFRALRAPVGPAWELPFRLAGSGAYILLLLLTIAVTLWWTRRGERIRFNATVS